MIPQDKLSLADSLAQERTRLAAERNLLAADRTFLAWLRTGLAGVAGGFAIIRLLSFETYRNQVTAYIVGEMLVLWGISIFFFALFEYKRICGKLEKDSGIYAPLWQRQIIAFVLIFLSFLILFLTLNG